MEISEEKIVWLKENYPNVSNAYLAKQLGIGLSSLRKIRKKYGLSKSEEYKHQCAKLGGETSKKVCGLNNFKAQRENMKKLWEGKKMHHEPKCHWINKPPEERDALIKKMSEGRKKLIAEERRRIRWGLAPRTKLTVLNERNRPRSRVKWKLLKAGYIFIKKWEFGYNSQTKRVQEQTEKRYEERFKFKFIQI